MNDHYFSVNPTSTQKPKNIKVQLNGRTYTLQTSSGVFSPGHLDTGTAVLLKNVPPAKGNQLLDIGCGWGPIALTMALQSPKSTVYAVDVNERSLELTQTNAEKIELDNIKTNTPEEVPAELKFDLIWSNPPIKVGKKELHNILNTWLPRLNKGGTAYLVVAKKLGAESLLKWLQHEHPYMTCTRYARDKGFHVLKVQN
ncbi:MAG: methyltransferase [Micrococcaceae bacterium]